MEGQDELSLVSEQEEAATLGPEDSQTQEDDHLKIADNIAGPLATLRFANFRSGRMFTFVILGLLTIPFCVIPFVRYLPEDAHTNPVFLTISWYLFISWTLGRIVQALRGPPVLGYLISGYCLQHVQDHSWMGVRPLIQLLSFLIVLTRAGMEISPRDLDAVSIALGVLPIAADALTITVFAMYWNSWSFVPAAMMAFVITPLGDGLVLPALGGFKSLNLSEVPKIMFTAAPLEVVFCLFCFGLLQGFAKPEDEPVGALIWLGMIKLFGSTLLAGIIALCSAQLAANRKRTFFGRQIFAGTDTEELLIVLGSVLLVYVLGSNEPTIIWNFYNVENSLFQGDLAVVAYTFFFAILRPQSIHAVEDLLTKLWMFGALFLFTSLGVNIKASSFVEGYHFFPLLFVGLLGRLVMILVIAFVMPFDENRKVFVRGGPGGNKRLLCEALFCWVCSFPRATLQGSLCRIPGIMMLFSDDINHEILHAGVFVLAVMAPVGAVLLDKLGTILLYKIKAYEDADKVVGVRRGYWYAYSHSYITLPSAPRLVVEDNVVEADNSSKEPGNVPETDNSSNGQEQPSPAVQETASPDPNSQTNVPTATAEPATTAEPAATAEPGHPVPHADSHGVTVTSPLETLPYAEFRAGQFFTALLLVLFAIPFLIIPYERYLPEDAHTIPVFLTLAWYLFVSWTLGRIVQAIGGPPVLGYLISGFCLQNVQDVEWMAVRPSIQMLSYLIVLTKAGVEISPPDLDPTSIVLGVLPILADALTITCFAMYLNSWPFVPAAMLAFVMSPLGDGLLKPALVAFRPVTLSPLPKVMFTVAPLEVVVCLFCFGILQGFAKPAGEPLSALIGLGIFGKMLGSIVLAGVIAFCSAQLAANRKQMFFGRRVFTGTDQEELLFLLASVLLVYVLASNDPTVIWNGYSVENSFFQADLAVVAYAFFFAQLRPLNIHAVEDLLRKLWMFVSLFLFTSLGVSVRGSSFVEGYHFFSLLFVGLFARLVMILCIAFVCPLSKKRKIFVRGAPGGNKRLLREALFCWACSFPRAILQGALSRIPGIMDLFSNDVNNEILHAGVFILAVMAPLGTLLLEKVGVVLLKKIKALEDAEKVEEGVVDEAPDAVADQEEWRHRDRAAAMLKGEIGHLLTDAKTDEKYLEFARETPAPAPNMEDLVQEVLHKRRLAAGPDMVTLHGWKWLAPKDNTQTPQAHKKELRKEMPQEGESVAKYLRRMQKQSNPPTRAELPP